MKGRFRTVLRAGHQVQLLQGWDELFAGMRQAIENAMHEVRLETYIYGSDSAGEQMCAALVQAARRGVAVHLVVDGVGTPRLPPAWAEAFNAAGVRWHVYKPAGWLGMLLPSRWRRLHRKMCLVDGEVAFCGGINVLDDRQDPNHGTLEAPRLDFSVRVTGPLTGAMHEVMTQTWLRLQAASEVRDADWPAAWRALQEAMGPGRGRRAAPTAATVQPGARAALLLRDNIRHRRRIELAYLKAIAQAHEEIIIANAYFLPGRKLRQALIVAAQRGVRVRLLLQGRYEYFMQYHAVRPVYGPLLQAGVEIHEYAASFLHAKVAVVDGHWATVGSSNLDPLSLLLAREANVVIDDVDFAGGLRERLVRAMEHEGRHIDPQAYTRRPWHQHVLDRMAFGLLRAILFLTGRRY
ncbi:MAG: cardiolipin synthase ClsB [Curvibacter sp.]|jgi:cardiolipin synthase|nr:cardiolipin synthase ClsB [Curvibacter sp.]